jgi:hypothetical protein
MTFYSAGSYSIAENMDYLPFGEQVTGGTATTHKFAGKERDPESGHDNFGARYNSSNLGLWLRLANNCQIPIPALDFTTRWSR